MWLRLTQHLKDGRIRNVLVFFGVSGIARAEEIPNKHGANTILWGTPQYHEQIEAPIYVMETLAEIENLLKGGPKPRRRKSAKKSD